MNSRLYNHWLTRVMAMTVFLAITVVFKGNCAEPVAKATESSTFESCVKNEVMAAHDSMTIGELRSKCLKDPDESKVADLNERKIDAVERRLEVDEENVLRPFTIMAHRQNYFLFAAHNFQGYNSAEYNEAFEQEDISVKDTETQFQLSIKTPLAINIFDLNIDLFTAYTVRSFWQLYYKDASSPFRETNHNPEAWLQFHPDFELFGLTYVASALGFAHQSNGQSGTLSRSWNTVFADFIFNRGNFAFSIRPWLRIQESAEDDDNPDLTSYLGHGELRAAYKYNEHTFSFMSRNNLESGFSQGAVELGWSFPLFEYPYLKGYLQYFSGYGESLIDYDQYVNRLGVGIILTDLL